LIEHPYGSLEDVVQDPVFPEVDLALRRGRHVDLNDTEWFAFLNEAQELLEGFYRRFGCELIRVPDGYFHLLPAGDRLGRRHLTRGEMLVGQGLALMYLDPATVKQAGIVAQDQLLELLTSLVGHDRLIVSLNFRKKAPRDERIAAETARKEIAKAVRGLEQLGFLERLPDSQLRLRSPLMRFAEPVRGLGDPKSALAELVESGRVSVEGSDEGEQDELEDEEDGL